MIVAYPPSDEPVICDLVRHLNECAKAKYYIKLGNRTATSGFYAKATTLKAAKAEARNHLRRCRTWVTADIWSVRHLQTETHLASVFRR